MIRLESPQAFKVEDPRVSAGSGYPGGLPPRPPTGSSLWPHPLTPPPSSTDLNSAGSNPISASAMANPSHLSLHAHHTDLTGSMKGKDLTFFSFSKVGIRIPCIIHYQVFKESILSLRMAALLWVTSDIHSVGINSDISGGQKSPTTTYHGAFLLQIFKNEFWE